MVLHPIECGNFKLDGGAMFGVVPKVIWQKTNPADKNNLVKVSSRSLLIENGNRLILIDTGMGNKQSEKFFYYYNRWGDFSLEKSLKDKGFHPDDITDVFLTHLHFDHCGGAVLKTEKETLSLLLRMLSIGLTKNIGNGQPILTLGKKPLFCLKTFYQ